MGDFINAGHCFVCVCAVYERVEDEGVREPLLGPLESPDSSENCNSLSLL